jgi:hypothetical protein
MLFAFLMSFSLISAQNADQIYQAAGTPAHPKVPISWNHYNDVGGVGEILKKIAQAYPDLAKLESIGKSFKGNDIWVLTITDFKKGGDVSRKPGMYIDGNIHSNEIQGTEFALYTAWYLTESFAENSFIQELLQDKVFYINPTINPDGRDNFFKAGNNPNSPRSGLIPVDNDRDGLVNEDGFDDLDGDGNIVSMRRKSPYGKYKVDPADPRRMIYVSTGNQVEYDADKPNGNSDLYEILGQEGIDNDGDGQVNEDGEGYYDPNRDWAWNWQPNYIQNGAYKYPFSLPENRAVADFVMKHPNIAAGQSYHNNGGMILRGPGAEEDKDTYNAQDAAVYDIIGKKGEELLPGYKYMIVYKDLYTAFGGELDWLYGGRGIYTFSNELWTDYEHYWKKDADTTPNSYSFNRYLLFKDAFVDWKPYKHPQYGDVEIGGFNKNFGRNHPGFLLESDAHRNMAFTIYHAYHTPKLGIEEITEKDLGNGLKEVTAVISNKRLIPTHASQDLKFKIERPDWVSLTGAKVLAGMIVQNRDLNFTTEQTNNPQTIEVPNIAGNSFVTVRWIISGGGVYSVKVDSAKGGVVERKKGE